MHGKRGLPEKPTNFRGSTLRLFKYLSPYLVYIVLAIAFAIFGTVFSILSPKMLGNITNQIQYDITNGVPINLDIITKFGLILVVLYAFSYLFSFLQTYILAGITARISKKFRTDITRKINNLPLSYFDKKSYGDVLSRITNDVDTVATTLNNTFSAIITSVIMLLGTLIMMFIVSPILAVIVLAALPVTIAIAVVVMRKTQPMYRKQQETLGKLNGHIEEIYAGHDIVKAFGAEDRAIAEFDELNDSLYNAAWKAQFYSRLLEPLMNLIGNIMLVTIIVVGAILAINGTIGIGDVQSMCMYMFMFNGPITQLSQQMTQLQSTIAASERVFTFLDEKELSADNALCHLDPNSIKGDVTFNHVKFGYDSDKVIIKDFSANIKSGEKVALVGPTGAGKTTLVNLLMRFYELDGGSITIDGVDTRDLTRENIHDLFGMVLQDTWVFEGSVRENIVYSKENVTDEMVERASKLASLDHFVSTLPNGYDTILDDKVALSEGQKQLITIARAMIENAPMLILDEATSSVDTRTEILIQKAMDELTRGRTSFIIAHRLSTIRNADHILVLKDGDIIEQGTHESLMAKGGFYSDLYMSQFASSDDEK